MGFLDKFFGRSASKSAATNDSGVYYTVQCRRCQALVRTRIDLRNDVSLTDEGDAYFVRKTLVDSTCFSRIELEVRFDLNHRQIGVDIHGGTLVADQTEQTHP